MKALPRSIKYFFVIVILALLALIVFVATFDANRYKAQIIEQVEQATGRDFSIDGEINLSIFPWIGLQVEDAALGNEKGFKAAHFAKIKQLDLKVNVMPLLKKQVQVNNIRLHGLNVSLEVAEDKKNNWSSLTQAKAEDAEAAPEKEKQEEPRDGVSALQSLMVEGVEFVDAAIRYDDRSSNTLATVSELNLTTSAITFDEPVAIQFGTRIESNQPVIDTRLKLTTQLTFNKELTEFKLREFVFTILMNANEFITQNEQIEITSIIDVSMDAQRVDIKKMQLSALGTTTMADITVSQFLQTPAIDGGIVVQPFNAREVAKRLGVALPVMAKADALQKVTLNTKIKMAEEKLQADEFNLTLDGSVLTGWLHVLDLSKQQLRYKLAFDRLNLNDYLPPVAATDNTKPAAAAGTAASEETAATGDEKIELPVEMLRTLDVQGDFRIASLTAKEYDIKDFLMTLNARQGQIALAPISMRVLEGQVNSALKMNVKKANPAYAVKLDVKQVQMGPIANPVLADMMSDKPLTMAGAANVTMDVKTAGETVNQLKQASLGQLILDMKETRVDGFDPEFFMRSAVAEYIQSKGLGLSKTIMGSYDPRDVTVFDTIHSTVNIAKGKARTDDFLMDSKRVQIKAQGHADIMQDTMDITSSIQLARSKTAAEKILDSPLYVRTHGPFDALKYDIDTGRLAKSATDVYKKEAKAKVKAKVDEKRREVEDKAKQKVEDKLKDKLKGLF